MDTFFFGLLPKQIAQIRANKMGINIYKLVVLLFGQMRKMHIHICAKCSLEIVSYVSKNGLSKC